jgi:hypothetical protein
MTCYFDNVFNKQTKFWNFLSSRDFLLIQISHAVSILRSKFILLKSWPSWVSAGNDAYEQYSSNRMCGPICLCVAVRPHLALKRSRTTHIYKCCFSVYEQHHKLFALWNAKLEQETALLASVTYMTFRWCFVRMSIAFCQSVTGDIPN